MYYVYALKSLSRNYINVGISKDTVERLKWHNSGHERTTKPYRPFEIILSEKYSSRPEARAREKFLKSGFGKQFLKNLINKSCGHGPALRLAFDVAGRLIIYGIARWGKPDPEERRGSPKINICPYSQN